MLSPLGLCDNNTPLVFLLSFWVLLHWYLCLCQTLKYGRFSGAWPKSSFLTLHSHFGKSHLSSVVSIILYHLMTSKSSFSAQTSLGFRPLYTGISIWIAESCLKCNISRALLCCLGWNAVVRSELTAASSSWAQGVLSPQPPELPGLQAACFV